MVPGVNLRSVGTIRDAQKWPKRDKRTDQQRLDMIELQLAESVYHLQDDEAVGILKNLQELVGETSEVYYYQNTRIKGSSLRTALNLYGMAINKFLGNSLIKRLEGTDFRSMEEVWSQLKPTFYGVNEPKGGFRNFPVPCDTWLQTPPVFRLVFVKPFS